MVITANSINNNAPPIGTLQYFSVGGTDTTYPNQNWLYCDGSVVSQATYSALFSRVGLLSPGGSIWTRNAPMGGNDLQAIAYGNATYVTGGSSGAIFTSTNGTAWSFQTSGTVSTINCMTYGTVFVYGTQTGGLGTSTDGVTWTPRTSGTASNITNLAWNGSVYVFSAGGNFGTSTDAITWTATKIPMTGNSSGGALVYGAGRFVASPNIMVTSTDGIVWDTKTPTVGTNNLVLPGNTDLIYAGGKFVSGGLNGIICTSTDGVRWINRGVTTTTSTIHALVYGGVYVAGGVGGLVQSSTDAITWTIRTSNTASIVTALAFGNSTYVYGAASGGGGTSTDGTTWVQHNTGSTSSVNSITYGTVFAYGFNGGGISTSTDGITFTARTSGTSSTVACIRYLNSLYVYGTASGGLATSTDAITWTARTSGTVQNIVSLTYGTVYVGVGTGGTIISSTDAITWTTRNSGTTSTLNSVVYDGTKYYVGGTGANSGWILSSTDAVTWTAAVQNPTSVTALTYGTVFAYGGTADIYTSTDAMTWTQRTVIPQPNMSATLSTITQLIYANSMYFGLESGTLGGAKPYSNILTSTDAITWYQIPSNSTTTLRNLVYGTSYVATGVAGENVISSGTYSYNTGTSFQLPTDNNTIITSEAGNNYLKKLYIKAL